MQVIHGGKEQVEALLTHPDVRAVSFVGSAPVARSIYTTAAAHGKRVQALAGAKNHLVVLPDADKEQPSRVWSAPPAVRRASAAWRSAQRCWWARPGNG